MYKKNKTKINYYPLNMNIISKFEKIKNEKIKEKFSFICNNIRKTPEKLTNKQFYEKNVFFADLNSYIDFFSKDLYNFINYIKISIDSLKKKVNYLFFLYKFLCFFDLKFLKFGKKKLYSIKGNNFKLFSIENKNNVFLRLFYIINKINAFLIKEKIILKKKTFIQKEIAEIFSYMSKRSFLFYKSPIFFIELVASFFIRVFDYFIKQNHQQAQILESNYLLSKNIYKRKNISKYFLNVLYYLYLLKKQLTFSQILNLRNKFLLSDSLVIFRKQIIEKIFSLNFKIQLKKDFLKTLALLKNVRIYL